MRKLTDNELELYAAELHGRAMGGDKTAISKLFLLAHSLIVDRRKKSEKQSKSASKKGAIQRNKIIGLAIYHLQERAGDWDKMYKDLLKDKIADRKTIAKVIKQDREWIERIANLSDDFEERYIPGLDD